MNKATVRERIQFDLDRASIERLDKLVVGTHASSRAEVLRRAIKLLGVIMEIAPENGRITLQLADGRTIDLIIL